MGCGGSKAAGGGAPPSQPRPAGDQGGERGGDEGARGD